MYLVHAAESKDLGYESTLVITVYGYRLLICSTHCSRRIYSTHRSRRIYYTHRSKDLVYSSQYTDLVYAPSSFIQYMDIVYEAESNSSICSWSMELVHGAGIWIQYIHLVS